jgi:hypothetical protein
MNSLLKLQEDIKIQKAGKPTRIVNPRVKKRKFKCYARNKKKLIAHEHPRTFR